MENQQIEFYTKPNDNTIEECMKNRKRSYNQFPNYKEAFIAGLDQFIKPYEIYLNQMKNRLGIEYYKLKNNIIKMIIHQLYLINKKKTHNLNP